MQLQKYLNRMIDDQDDTIQFEFIQLEGKEDWGLLQTVFEEFVRHPILLSLERGRPIIKMAKSSIPNGLINVTVDEHPADNKIVITLRGSILKNRLVNVDKISEEVDSLQVGEDAYLILENLTANRVGTVLGIWYVINWLNGMPVEVNYEDYIPSCANCTMNTENLYKYYKLYDIQLRTFIERNEGCVCGQKEFKKGDGCDAFFIRNTYPDLGEVSEIIKDLI